MKNKNIVLIGFMGCGKSTLGGLLADKLDFNFIDMDNEIELQSGMEIKEIFKTYGEGYFRKLESDYCSFISSSGGNVIATGGGVVKNEKNISLLKDNGVLIYIKAGKEKVFDNVKFDTKRPLLMADDKLNAIENLLAQRIPLYERYSDLSIDVTNLNIDEAFLRLYETVVFL